MATVHLRIIGRLENLGDPLESLDDYVATLTFNTLHDHLRRRYPERTRLKNRLRYVLLRDDRLAIWPTPTGTATGLAKWKGRTDAGAFEGHVTAAMRERSEPAEAVLAMLRAAGGPVLFDALVELAAELWGVSDSLVARAAGTTPDVAAQVENRQFLRELWREILLLPPAQRKALLLNLRDADTVNVASLLVVTATAKFDEIAAAMEMRAEALAEIWNDLPLDDLRIGEMLGLTRQQVINLRKSARHRLARRLKMERSR